MRILVIGRLVGCAVRHSGAEYEIIDAAQMRRSSLHYSNHCSVWLGGVGRCTVVFNEVMYHPPQTNEAACRMGRTAEPTGVDMDIFGLVHSGGIDYSFPEGTGHSGGGYLVWPASPADLMAATGLTTRARAVHGAGSATAAKDLTCEQQRPA